MNLKKNFLIFAAAIVAVIALLYGVSPQWFARTFLGLPEIDRNLAHILRAVMGLYLAMGGFWLYAAFHGEYRDPALITSMLFAGGLVSGRFLSLLNEGLPAPLLTFYVVAELALVPIAYWIYTRPD
jgi:hypothetical protein